MYALGGPCDTLFFLLFFLFSFDCHDRIVIGTRVNGCNGWTVVAVPKF